MQTALRVVVPAAFSGITAAFILAVSRAVGETMIVAIAAGQQPRLTLDPLVPIETMTAYIVQVSLGDTPQGTLEYRTIFAVGMLLFLMTFALNLRQHLAARALPRGVRVSRHAQPDPSPAVQRSALARAAFPALLALSSRSASLAALLATCCRRRWAGSSWQFLTGFPSRQRRRGRASTRAGRQYLGDRADRR